MGKVLKFYPSGSPNSTLEACKDEFQDVLVIGYDHEGELRAFSSGEISKLSEVGYLVDVFKNALLTGYFVTGDKE